MTPLLEIAGLEVRYGERPALREVDLALDEGRVLAVVGESGSGKSTLALATARLLPAAGRVTAGRIAIDGVALGELSGKALRDARARLVGYIPQDAMAALTPVLPAGRQVAEVFEARDGASRGAARRSAVELLGRVGIQDPEQAARRYPHQLSGGMRQRVMIAMALAARPRLLIADEPTTALDVTVQAEILALARALVADEGATLLWVTHDMGVVAELADEVAVVYGGRLVEHGPAVDVFAAPAHPYTRAVLDTVRAGRDAPPKTPFHAVAGQPPTAAVPSGCPFHPRCPVAVAACVTAMPPTTAAGPGRRAACHLLGGAA